MGKRKLALVLAVVCALALTHLFVYPLDKFLTLLFAERMQCAPGDTECLQRMQSLRDNCTPSVSIVTVGNGTNNLTIRVTTYWKGDKCVTEEEVISDDNSGLANFNITGYKTECELDGEKLEKFGQKACNGSLLSFVGGGESAGEFSEPSGDEEVFQAYCSLEAEDCKEEAATRIKTCGDSEILMDQELNHTQGGLTYWTLFIKIETLPVEYTDTGKLPERCSIYHELINAVNLPPEIPPSIVGMTMTCTIESWRFPISAVTVNFCEGDLIDYIQLIYP
jgi:hypothetical protein